MTDLSRWRRSKTDLPTKIRETAGLLRLMVSRSRGNPSAVYDLLAAHNNLGRDTLYLNLGYWKDAKTYDEACEALALRLAEKAALGQGHTVLDAGFGFADQDVLWARRFGVRIVGFNINEAQVKVARERVAEAGLGDRIELRCGSVLTTGLADRSVDRVLALESAFHFPTREAFFHEAHRVLVPGGRIALADICAAAGRKQRLFDRVSAYVARAGWQIPDGNDYDAVAYAAKMRAAGFVDVEVENISEHVFRPFGTYSRVRQAEADVAARANPLLRAMWTAPTSEQVYDYVVVTARRPEVDAEVGA